MSDPIVHRSATIDRHTRETRVRLSLDLDGSGHATISTGVGFFDHMLDHVARHGMIDLNIDANGDLHVDDHHTVEDVSLVFGSAVLQALGDKRGIVRYGHSVVPMDDAMAEVAIDLSGRAAFVYRPQPMPATIGRFDVQLAEESLKSIAQAGHFNLHVVHRHGSNAHHLIEATYKAFGRALRQAVAIDPRRGNEIPSTKGSL